MFVAGSRFVRWSLVGVPVLLTAVCGGVIALGWEGPADIWVPLVVAAPLALIDWWLVRRAMRVGVSCSEQEFLVHGLLWSRTVPMHRVRSIGRDEVSDRAWISWGRIRRTPLTCCSPLVLWADDSDERLERLRAFWIEQRFAGGVVPRTDPVDERAVPGLVASFDLGPLGEVLDDVPFPYDAVHYDPLRRSVTLTGYVLVRPRFADGRRGLRRRVHEVTVQFAAVDAVAVRPDSGPLVLSWGDTVVDAERGRVLLVSSDDDALELWNRSRRASIEVAAGPVSRAGVAPTRRNAGE